jgi:hypothetical protein
MPTKPRKQIRVSARHATRSRLPFPRGGSKSPTVAGAIGPNPTNADIMKAIDQISDALLNACEEIKANQEQIQEDINKIKAHIGFLDQAIMFTFANTDNILDIAVPHGNFNDLEAWLNSLPSL